MRILIFLVLIVLASCSHPTPRFDVGYRSVFLSDSSRIFNAELAKNKLMHFRPIDIDVWYPTDSVNLPGETIEYGYFLGLLESRALKYLDNPAYKGFTAQMANDIVGQLKCSDTSRFLHYKTASYLNRNQSKGTFPLVIYLASYNGMGYENVPLMESLVKKGFVVASVNSIGRYPGDMTTKKEDLMEQVNDAIKVYSYCKSVPGVDTTNITLIGYSWGGLAAALLSPHITHLKRIISLDGSEFHHYSGGSAEDKDFDSLRSFSAFKDLKIKVPYFRFEQSAVDTSAHYDSVYNFKEKLANSQVSIQKVSGAEHIDFSSFRYIVNQSGNCPSKSLFIDSVVKIIATKE